ncbi:hypothetical protein Scep_015631 [Stephania cephalantha]|uniref:Ribosome biogenesis protein NOP53 n=1 Tax=Stephania cephalantha TaxID=152367 RepID=A0AAP0J4B6_9MAGN
MGKAKSSRKGKKAWRANISTADIDDYFERSTKDALSGGSLVDLPSDSLFFVDKSSDFSVKRKIEKQREKTLHCDRVLQRNSFVQAVPSSKLKKSKKRKKNISKVESESKDAVEAIEKEQVSASGMSDIWDDKGEDDLKVKKKPKPSIIPAVEVEPLGCSFNPPHEAHQDSLARAVAEEMQKIYKDELGPQPVPHIDHSEAMDEEDMLFLDVDDQDDDKDEDNSENNGTDTVPEKRSSRPKTRVELNHKARVKEQLRAEAEAKKMEELSKEIDSVSDILQEIAKEDEEKQQRHIRRVVAKQERLKSGPPRLGKHKFQPLPPQVLLSEEISGSLRKLKGCCTLARDRFKSLEKRGLVVPSVRVKSAILYTATRGEKDRKGLKRSHLPCERSFVYDKKLSEG